VRATACLADEASNEREQLPALMRQARAPKNYFLHGLVRSNFGFDGLFLREIKLLKK
jgi:hypothetical protein